MTSRMGGGWGVPGRFAPLLIFVLYLAVGALGAQLVLPGGYASAIWPAAGIGLLGAFLCGWRGCLAAALASFLLNLGMGSGEPQIAAGIATAVGFQAAWGAFLVRHLFGGPPAQRAEGTATRLLDRVQWSSPSSVALFLMVAALGGTLVAPTISLLILSAQGDLPGDPLLSHWATWWLGDAVGVVVVAPPIFMLLDTGIAGGPRKAVLLTQGAMLLGMAMLLTFVRGQEHSSALVRLEGQAQLVTQAIRKQIEQTLQGLEMLAVIAEIEGDLQRSTFERLASRETVQPGVLAMEWAPRVEGQQLQSFESAARAQGYAEYRVTERDDRGQLRPVGPRDSYTPILHLYPASDRKAQGFDLTSDPSRAAAVRAAETSGRTAATEPVKLIRHQPVLGFLVVVPAFRQQSYQGAVLGVFGTNELLEGALSGVTPQGYTLQLIDVTSGSEPVLLSQFGDSNDHAQAPSVSEVLDFAGRNWQVRLSAAARPPVEEALRQLALPVILLVFASLLTALVITGAARGEEVERLVQRRTLDLSQEVRERVLVEQQLRQADRVRSQFLATMSHELRTPLNAVIGFSEILREESFGPLNEKQTRYVDHVLRSAHHLLTLINDVLDLTKVEAGEMSLHLTPIDPRGPLEEALSSARLAASKKDVSLVVESPESLPQIAADPGRFRQILLNLLTNAVKFTPAGGNVKVVMVADESFLRVEIADSGIGLAEQDLDKIFESFYQVDSSYSREQEGTGLGLSLSRHLAGLHGGTLSATSEGLGKGSTFHLLMPLRQEGFPS